MDLNNTNKSLDKPNAVIKEKYVNELINKVALEFKAKGINQRHIEKAKKYYLNLEEVKDNSPITNEFKNFIEKELYALALNTEKNYINELKKNNKIEENTKELFQNDEDNLEIAFNYDKEKQVKEENTKDPLLNGEDNLKTDVDKNNEKPKKENKTNLNFDERYKSSDKNTKDDTELEKNNNKFDNITLRKNSIINLIEKVATEYEGKGVNPSHVDKAKKHYLKILDDNYLNLAEEEFEKLLKDIEYELYALAEETKDNYINVLKMNILENPKIDLEEKKQLVEEIYLTKSEKTKIVTKLIDRIADEYSNDGVFDRHIKKAYNIFLNREEVSDKNLSLDDFNKFINQIEQELYSLAEQTKKNYEYYRKESESYGKVLKKGEDIK